MRKCFVSFTYWNGNARFHANCVMEFESDTVIGHTMGIRKIESSIEKEAGVEDVIVNNIIPLPIG